MAAAGTGEPMLDVRRREFITLLGGATVAWPLTARAQQAVRRIGVLFPGAADDQGGQARLAAFLQALQPLGWTDGRNVQIEYRWGGGDAERVRKHANELAALAPDVILTTGTGALGALLH
jgi:putative ABC transport system substrate-binding protein